MPKHYIIKHCKKCDRFTFKKKGGKYKKFAPNFSKAFNQMVIVEKGGDISHRHRTLDETYSIRKCKCDKCI